MFGRLGILAELKLGKIRDLIEPPEQKIEFYLEKTSNIHNGYVEERNRLSDAIKTLRREETANNNRIRELQNDAYDEKDETKQITKLEVAYYQQLRTDVISAEIKAYDIRLRDVNSTINEIDGKVEMLKLQSELMKIKKDLKNPNVNLPSRETFDPNSINEFLDKVSVSAAVQSFKSDSPTVVEDKDEWIRKRLARPV